MSVKFLDLDILEIDLDDLMYQIENSIIPDCYHFCSADAIVQADLAAPLKKIFQRGILVCDSHYLKMYLNFRQRNVFQIRGADFLRRMLSSKEFISDEHLFIVANNELKNRLDKFIICNDKRKERRINIYVPGKMDHWDSENNNIEKYLLETNIKFIWVGIGSPKQFYLSDYLNSKFRITTFSVGAAFDFVLGTKKEANRRAQKLGLEWFLRFCSEPKRLWKRYLIGNLYFIILLLKDLRQ